MHCILSVFEDSFGQGCNLARCQMAPIRCSEDQLQIAADTFPCQVMECPIRYLRIPLPVKKLPNSALQLLIDRITGNLPIWKGRFLHRSGRDQVYFDGSSNLHIHQHQATAMVLEIMSPDHECLSLDWNRHGSEWQDLGCLERDGFAIDGCHDARAMVMAAQNRPC
jgi:hypothetical protein